MELFSARTTCIYGPYSKILRGFLKIELAIFGLVVIKDF